MATEQELKNINPLHKEFQSLLDQDFKDRKLKENEIIPNSEFFIMEDGNPVKKNTFDFFKNKKVVLITHGPAYKSKLDKLGKRHIGNIDYRKFIERIKPKLAISGHLHETIGEIDKIGNTKLINPCWDGMVIELK